MKMSSDAHKGVDVGLLLLRLGTGFLLIFGHGWSKLGSVGKEAASMFPDPIGLGPELSNFLAAMSEVVFASLVCLGLFTRFACIPIIVQLLVAIFIFHANHHLFHQMLYQLSPEVPVAISVSKEFPSLFLIPYLTLLFTGPGSISLDRQLGIESKLKNILSVSNPWTKK